MTHSTTASRPISETLRSHGVIPTAQRVEIAKLVLDRPMHVSADALHKRVNASGRYVSKATVYNTLGLFVDKGLLREVLVDPDKLFYDSNTSPHHHFYDVDTGELTDIPADQVAVEALPVAPDGVEIQGVDIVVRVRRNATE